MLEAANFAITCECLSRDSSREIISAQAWGPTQTRSKNSSGGGVSPPGWGGFAPPHPPFPVGCYRSLQYLGDIGRTYWYIIIFSWWNNILYIQKVEILFSAKYLHAPIGRFPCVSSLLQRFWALRFFFLASWIWVERIFVSQDLGISPRARYEESGPPLWGCRRCCRDTTMSWRGEKWPERGRGLRLRAHMKWGESHGVY